MLPHQLRRLCTQATTKVDAFADLQPYLRRFLRAVHPDVVFALDSTDGTAVADNNASLRLVNGLVDGVSARCEATRPKEAPKTAVPPKLPPLQLRYDVKFHYVRPSSTPASLASFNLSLTVPSPLVTETDMLARRGRPSSKLHARWLQFGADAVRQLLGAVGQPVDLLVPDADGDQRPAKRKRPRRFAGAFPPQTADPGRLLRDNLVTASPLKQGKIHHFPTQASIKGRATVFPLKQRQERVGRLLQRGVLAADASVPPQDAQVALLRLTGFLVDQFERLQVYDPVWDTLSVRLAHVYLCSTGTRQLIVPHNFEPAALAGFLDDNFNGISREAAAGALRKAKHRV